MFGINAAEAQGCDCMFTFCHAPLKTALLLHKMAKVPYSFSETVIYVQLELTKYTTQLQMALGHVYKPERLRMKDLQ